jgi:membrane associated rhomboid family serine protease
MTMAPVGIRCPEHSGKPQGVQKLTRPVTRAVTQDRGSLVTRVLIGLNVAIYLAELLNGAGLNAASGSIFQNGALIARGREVAGILVPVNVYPIGAIVGVAEGQWWRLLTSAFLHYGPIHLALNMYSLYFAGSVLESYLGRGRFLLLYIVSGLAGSAGALVLKPDLPTVGASGAIFGILGALLVLERSGRLATGGQVAGLIVINLIFTFTFRSFISVGGHVGGLLGGFLAMGAMTALMSRPRYRAFAPVAVAAVGIVAVAVAYWKVHHLGQL